MDRERTQINLIRVVERDELTTLLSILDLLTFLFYLIVRSDYNLSIVVRFSPNWTHVFSFFVLFGLPNGSFLKSLQVGRLIKRNKPSLVDCLSLFYIATPSQVCVL